MPRLIWLDSTEGGPALAPLWTFLAEQVAILADGRFETELRHVPFASGGVRNPATRLLNDAAMLAAASSIKDDADVLVMGCWAAPTAAVRAALQIPVSSLPDASVRAVGSLAQRAAVVTVAPSLVPIFEGDLVSLGATGFLTGRPVWAYDPESSHAHVVHAIAEPSELIERFDRVARDAVRAGADAIVVGCGYLAPIFSAHGYTAVSGHPEVPVYDCNRLAFEHAAQLHRLQSSGLGPAPLTYAAPSGRRGELFARAVLALTQKEGMVTSA